MEFYYVAFVELSSCRFHDFGHIPWTAINDYSGENALDDYQAELLISVVRGVDAWFMEYMISKNKTKPGKGKARKPKAKK